MIPTYDDIEEIFQVDVNHKTNLPMAASAKKVSNTINRNMLPNAESYGVEN